MITSANSLALKSLLFCASLRGKLWVCCQHMAFLPLGGKGGVVLRSRVLSVLFHIPGQFWGCSGHRVSPQLCLSLCCSLQALSSPWHSQGHGSSRSTRTLPDGLWESRTPQGVLYSSTRLFTKWETQQLEPMKQLLAYWGKTHGLWWWCLLIICAVAPRGGSVLPLGLAVFALSHSVDARR